MANLERLRTRATDSGEAARARHSYAVLHGKRLDLERRAEGRKAHEGRKLHAV